MKAEGGREAEGGRDQAFQLHNCAMTYGDAKAQGSQRPHRIVAETTKPYGDLKTRTYEFALKVVRFYAGLSSNRAAQHLGDQAMRAGTSVGAHYREASRSRSNAEFISKLEVLLQELDEAIYWMSLLRDSGETTEAVIAPLLDESNQLIAIFVTCVNKVKARPKT